MRVLVFGGGSRLARRLGVKAIWKPWLVSHDEGDVRSMSDIMFMVDDCQPDVVVNCAAVTDVDLCERAKEHALSVNALGAANVAMVCRMKDVPLVHVSTDYVFSGTNGPKGTDDVTYPVNAYGLSKLLGESAVLSIMPTNAIVVRVGWLYGVEYPKCQPMVAATQSDAQSPAHVYDNIKGNPTPVSHAASGVNSAIYTMEKAIYWKSCVVHVGPKAEPTTWYEFLKDDFNILPLKEGTYKGAKVAPGVRKSTWRPTEGGLIPSEGWEVASYRVGLDEFVKEFHEAFPTQRGKGS